MSKCYFTFCGKRGLCTVKESTSLGKEYQGNFIWDERNSIPILIQLACPTNKISNYTIKQTLMHELFEGGLLLMGVAFTPINPNNEVKIYSFNHMDLSNVIDNVYSAYYEIVNKLKL